MKKIYFKLPLIALAAVTLALGSCQKEKDADPGEKAVTKEIPVSKQAGNMNAVLEEYTGVRCTFCPDGHRRAQKFADENPGRVVLINVHTGSYATPAAGWPDFTTKYGSGLASISGLAGYPAGSINRFTFDGGKGAAPYYKQGDNSMALSRGGFAAAGMERMSQPTNVNMGLKTEYMASTRTLTITVNLYYTGTESVANYLNVAILENEVIGRQIDMGVDNPEYVHRHMLRDLITGQWGEKVTTTAEGTMYTKQYTYVVPEGFKAENIEVAAFVSQEANGKKVPIINGVTVKTHG